MANDSGRGHPHLQLAREEPVTERRTRRGFSSAAQPDDPQRHATLLGERLQTARDAAAAADVGGYDERSLIKIKLADKVPPEDVAKAAGNVRVVSQEADTLLLAFGSKSQLDTFEARLASLAAGELVSYSNVLYALQDLDRWTLEDRTGWALRRDGMPDHEPFVLDAEVWPLERTDEAHELRRAFERWITEQDGAILDAVRQPHLTMYRIRCTRALADDLLRHRDVRTVDLPPRIGLERSLVSSNIHGLGTPPPPPDGAPGIAVLDSGLVAGHPLLASAVGDAQSFLPGAPAADEHGHGTFVSGVALYDDVADGLREGSFVPELRLFSGRILNERSEGDGELVENQVERAVRYFVDNYGCRIFNLSYGDQNKPYHGRHVAGLAVTLDALSRELDVLFVVPTGNYNGDEAGPGDWRTEYPHYLTRTGASLLDPAPALNAITVGSIARNERNERWPEDPGYLPIARTGQPSPFTRHGPSVKGAIKPDLVDYGGNYAVDARAGVVSARQGVGELSISRDFAEGRLFAGDSGTSFAAPRVANAAARILAEHPAASVDLCRALLVAHARTPGACADLFAADADALRNVTGYGQVDRSALCQSLEDCVTLWAAEAIENRRHHFYEIPVPDDFWQGDPRTREVTVALAFRPAVRTTRIDYRAAFAQLQAHPGRVTRSGRALVQRPSGQSRRRERARACRRSPVLGDCSLSGNGSGIHVDVQETFPVRAESVLVRRGDAQRSDLGSRSLARPGAICARRGSQRPRGRTTAPAPCNQAVHTDRSAPSREGQSQGEAVRRRPVAGRSGQAACPPGCTDSAARRASRAERWRPFRMRSRLSTAKPAALAPRRLERQRDAGGNRRERSRPRWSARTDT